MVKPSHMLDGPDTRFGADIIQAGKVIDSRSGSRPGRPGRQGCQRLKLHLLSYVIVIVKAAVMARPGKIIKVDKSLNAR